MNRRQHCCPECETPFTFRPGLIGQVIRCQSCSHVFEVEDPAKKPGQPSGESASAKQPVPPPLPRREPPRDDRPRARRDSYGRINQDVDDDRRPRSQSRRRETALDAPTGSNGKGLIITLGVISFLVVAGIGALVLVLAWPKNQINQPAPQVATNQPNQNLPPVVNPNPGNNPIVQPPRAEERNLDDILNQGNNRNPNLPPQQFPPNIPKQEVVIPKNPGMIPPPNLLPPRKDPPPTDQPKPGSLEIKPKFAVAKPVVPKTASFEQDILEIATLHVIGQVIPCQAGQLLLLNHQQHQKISVLNVSTGKIIKTIDVNERQALVAGGHDFFVVYQPKANTLTRYSATTFEIEEIHIRQGEEIVTLGMGTASNGPLICHLKYDIRRSRNWEQSFEFLNPKLMKADAYKIDNVTGGFPIGFMGKPVDLSVSANGAVFSPSTRGASSGGNIGMFSDDQIKRFYKFGGRDGSLVSHDGKFIFTENQILTTDLNPAMAPLGGGFNKTYLVPAVNGPEYLAIGSESQGGELTLKTFEVRTTESKEIVGRFPTVDGVAGICTNPFGSEMYLGTRLFFISGANVLVVHPPKTPNCVMLHKMKQK